MTTFSRRLYKSYKNTYLNSCFHLSWHKIFFRRSQWTILDLVIYSSSFLDMGLLAFLHYRSVFCHNYTYSLCNFELTTIVPSRPWFWWNLTISVKGKSQITSEFKTKKGSSFVVKISRDKAKGPAVPKRWDRIKKISCEHVILVDH